MLMEDNALKMLFKDEHLLTYLLLIQFQNRKPIEIIIDAIYDKVVRNHKYFWNMWASVSYISMLNEQIKAKLKSEKDLLKDNIEEKNAFTIK